MTTTSNRARKQGIVASLADIQAARVVTAPGPSGLVYKIRPMNMERYALAGGLPASLRELALKGAQGVAEVLSGTQEVIDERGSEVGDYLDGLVRQVVVEPSLTDVDLDELPPVDYRWLVAVALGEMVHDGEGRRLWGREPLSSFATFRDFHDCPADCRSCERMVASVARASFGPDDGLAPEGGDHGAVRAAAR